MTNLLDKPDRRGVHPWYRRYTCYMDATTDQPVTRHTCTRTGKALPFGRKAPVGQCPRCDQLRNGAAPRTLSWVEDQNRKLAYDRADQAAHRAHFAVNGPHQTGLCGSVCTFGDW